MRNRKPKAKNEPNAKEPPHKLQSDETPNEPGRASPAPTDEPPQERVDEASQESFPASDPPAHRGQHI